MNTNHLFTILLSLGGLLTVPQPAFLVAASKAPACFQSDRDFHDDIQRRLREPGDAEANEGSDASKGGEEPEDRADGSMSSSLFDPDPSSKFMSPSRELVRPLIRAIRLHNEGDHNDAAEIIGQFLADAGQEDFLVLVDRSKGTAVSVNKVATEMLAMLPKSAIDGYRVRFGVPARQRLSLAIAESNYFEIAQVMKRFPYTDAGVEAAILIGHYHFDAGRTLLAAESFQTALDLGRFSKKPDPQLFVLAAVSWTLARRP